MFQIRIKLLLVFLPAISFALAQDGGVVASATPDVNYKISPNDKLQVSVYEEPDLTVEVVVGGNGTVTLPLIQQIKVSGRTSREVEMAIAAAYKSQRYLRNPQITITVLEFAQRTVSVLGQVNKPGSVPIPGGQTSIDLLVAIAGAGDFRNIANKKKVKITRKNGARGKSITVNVVDLLEGNRDQVFYLYPGDIVLVPQRIF